MTGYSEMIIDILQPKVGQALAQSALRIKCKKLGIDPENITADKVPLLANDLYEPLRIFAGETPSSIAACTSFLTSSALPFIRFSAIAFRSAILPSKIALEIQAGTDHRRPLIQLSSV